jgi:MFS family permease
MSEVQAVDQEATYRRVTWRLIPLLLLCYFAAYVDRINIGFAQTSMSADLRFSASTFGTGAGIFFIGYLFFEIPSNMLMQRIGARRTLSRILIFWGAVSTAMMFTSSPVSFYVLRFLLGVAEAGFFPGAVLYLTYWYPVERRAKIIALFMTPVAFSGLLGGPLSGWILQNMGGVHGWAAWQWMFLVEGVPSIVLGLIVIATLSERPRDAAWLSPGEKDLLERNVAAEQAGGLTPSASDLLPMLRAGRTYILSYVYFALVAGVITISFWVPTLIKALFPGGSAMEIGLLTAIPYACGGIGMVVIGARSDRTGERRWHTVAALIIGALGITALAAVSGSLLIGMMAMSLASIGIFAGFPVFWAASTQYLPPRTVATGLAFVSSVGQLGGLLSPILIGRLKDSTGSFSAGLFAISAILILGAIGMVIIRPGRAGSGVVLAPS